MTDTMAIERVADAVAGADLEADSAARRQAEDVRLLARVAERDPRAVEALYARYAAPLYSLAIQVTGDAALGGEVLQATFLDLWQTAASFDPGRGGPAPWLFSMTRRKAIELVRREAGGRTRAASVDHGPRGAHGDGDTDAAMGVRREQLRDAMLDLAPVHHEALALAFFGGLTHVEVAERLGIPPVTARNRIRTALLRLRDVLSDPAREPTGAAVVAPRQRRLAEGRSGPPDWG